MKCLVLVFLCSGLVSASIADCVGEYELVLGPLDALFFRTAIRGDVTISINGRGHILFNGVVWPESQQWDPDWQELETHYSATPYVIALRDSGMEWSRALLECRRREDEFINRIAGLCASLHDREDLAAHATALSREHPFSLIVESVQPVPGWSEPAVRCTFNSDGIGFIITAQSSWEEPILDQICRHARMVINQIQTAFNANSTGGMIVEICGPTVGYTQCGAADFETKLAEIASHRCSP